MKIKKKNKIQNHEYFVVHYIYFVLLRLYIVFFSRLINGKKFTSMQFRIYAQLYYSISLAIIIFERLIYANLSSVELLSRLYKNRHYVVLDWQLLEQVCRFRVRRMALARVGRSVVGALRLNGPPNTRYYITRTHMRKKNVR